jgi:uncharacterized protein (DUF1778 family)
MLPDKNMNQKSAIGFVKLMLSEQDREVFFDTLMNPPAVNERLSRALAEHKRRIEA